MPLADLYHVVAHLVNRGVSEPNYPSIHKPSSLLPRLSEAFLKTWDLGFTAFGGPPVHFQILYKRFVDDDDSHRIQHGGAVQPRNDRKTQPWISAQVYQELFAISQALPGPGSTKMLFSIVLQHAGFLPAILTFFLWSIPGALGMYALSLGVSRIEDTLPGIAYAVLTGLNASTVGIVTVAAVQLAERAVKGQANTDEKVLNRILIIGGGCAGVCYSALWYFPVIIAIGGIVTVIWDLWMSQAVRKANIKLKKRRQERLTRNSHGGEDQEELTETRSEVPTPPSNDRTEVAHDTLQRRTVTQSREVQASDDIQPLTDHDTSGSRTANISETSQTDLNTAKFPVSVKMGIFLVCTFIAFLSTLLILRTYLPPPTPLPLSLLSNMFLAGTVIFGGGPVVIPLLREYVVVPGWVSPRDFLIGLAIIQAFPGPNFNFAVYLGALTIGREYNSAAGAVMGAAIAFAGIFAPGLILASGFQGFWNQLRSRKAVVSGLRGVNATAVGLVFTAVYRLWQIGYLKAADGPDGTMTTVGVPLAEDPWWIVITVLTYAQNKTFGVPAPVAILVGGILGLGWYGVTGG